MPPEPLTIDQLAERSGITRPHHPLLRRSAGCCPPPQLRGRTGLYGPDHLARLELVSELSALGFTLAAIEEHLARLPAERRRRRAGPAPGAAHAVGARAAGGARPGRAGPPGRARARRRRPGRAGGARASSPLLDGDRVRLHGAGTLAGGLAVLDSELPTEFWRQAHELIEKHTTALAEDLMALFQDEVLQPYRDRGRPAAERAPAGRGAVPAQAADRARRGHRVRPGGEPDDPGAPGLTHDVHDAGGRALPGGRRPGRGVQRLVPGLVRRGDGRVPGPRGLPYAGR